MPILEMIPREYWLQLHRELLPLMPELLAEEQAAKEERNKQEAERLDTLRRRYDEAIQSRMLEKKRAQTRAAAQRYRQRKQQKPQ